MLKRCISRAGPWLLAAALVLAVLAVRPVDAEFNDREVLTALAVDTETGAVQSLQLDVIAVSEASSIGGLLVDVAGALAPPPAPGVSSHLARAARRNDVLIEPTLEGPAGLTSTESLAAPASVPD